MIKTYLLVAFLFLCAIFIIQRFLKRVTKDQANEMDNGEEMSTEDPNSKWMEFDDPFGEDLIVR